MGSGTARCLNASLNGTEIYSGIGSMFFDIPASRIKPVYILKPSVATNWIAWPEIERHYQLDRFKYSNSYKDDKPSRRLAKPL